MIKKKSYLVSYTCVSKSGNGYSVGDATVILKEKRKNFLSMAIINKLIEKGVISEAVREWTIITFVKEL